MNERIRQLAEQAGCKVMDGEWYIPSATGLEKIVYTKEMGLEKFAELIVRDCMDVVDGYTKPRTFDTHYDAVEQIEALFGIKHFGVEE
jgi:hypothetical protein